MFFFKKVSVIPNTIGVLFFNNKLKEILEPGVYWYFNLLGACKLVLFPNTSVPLTITNQEVMTSDNISLRLSYFVQYKITDIKLLLSQVDLSKEGFINISIDTVIHNQLQIMIRKAISQINSEELNEKRDGALESSFLEFQEIVGKYGIKCDAHALKDILFPKQIQDLFAKNLESKIRSKTELENARTAVATARALKNATELSKDGGLQFFHLLETINKVSDKGKLTFVLGDIGKYAKE